MSIRYYSNETAFNIETPGELFDAIDLLHTQVMDNFGDAESAPYLDILEKAMAALDDLPVGPAVKKGRATSGESA